ncbi:LamG-like jellyroll fold domain-containing protein [Marivirga sp.]|uniref:LamG-like jellyroll fold domain-containing protein n=1 Tax=Marivirga sp. TaxID=2018662 RepID=UPI003DA77F3F
MKKLSYSLLLTICIVFILKVQINAQNIVADFPFNGNTLDESGSENHGTLNGATLTRDRFGNEESAYFFDGIDDYIDVGKDSTLNLKDGFSISFWFKAIGTGFYQSLVSRGWQFAGDYSVELQYNNAEQYYELVTYLEGSANLVSQVVNREWNHYAVTFKKGENGLRIYLNGELISSSTINSDLTEVSDYNFRIGNSEDGGFHFKGAIDDVKVYDYEISQENVSELAANEAVQVGALSSGYGAALSFDGEKSFIAIDPNVSIGLKDFTFETQIKIGSTNPNSTVIWNYGVGNDRFISLGLVAQRLKFRMQGNDESGVYGTTTLDAPTDFPLNKWTHLVLTFNEANKEVKVYVDGTLVIDEVITRSQESINIVSQWHVLGYDRASRSTLLNAEYDETRLWNIVRTQNEISAYENVVIKEYTPGLIYVFNYNEGIPNGDNRGLEKIKDVINGYQADLLSFNLVGDFSNFINTNLGRGTPVISRISKKSSIAAEQLTIYGTGFLEGRSSNEVLLGGNRLKVLEATSKRILVELPEKFSKFGEQKLSVENLRGFSWPVNFGTLYSDSSYTYVYEPRQIAGGMIGSLSASVADFNGDGNLDIITGASDLYMIKNQGNGIFDNKIVLKSNCNCNDYKSVDLDNDGDIDIVYKNNIGQIRWLENIDFTASFVDHNIDLADNGFGSKKIEVADIDNDGYYDIIEANFDLNDLGSLNWYRNNGSQLFDAKFTLASNVNATGVGSFDIDNDGDFDIIASFGLELFAFFNTQNGNVFVKKKIGETNPRTENVNFNFADINTDNFYEIVVTNFENQFLINNLANGDTTFTRVNLPGYKFNSIPADADGDGDTDFFVGATLFKSNSLLLNDGSGSFSEIQLAEAKINGKITVIPGDFDADGDIDAVSISEGDGVLRFFEHVNSGNDITDFSISEQVDSLSPIFDYANNKIDLVVPNELTDFNLIPIFKTSFRSKIKINDTEQISGVTVVNMSNSTLYEVVSENNVSKMWTVKLNPLPGVPTITEVDDITQTEAEAEWTETTFTDYYILQISDDEFDSYTEIQSNDTELILDLEPGTNYALRIKAVNAFGESSFSEIEDFSTIPSNPQIGSFSDFTPVSALVNWQAVEGADSYLIDVAKDSSFNDLVGGYSGRQVNTLEENIINLQAANTYYVRLRAVNESGISGYSNVKNFTTLPAIPVFSSLEITNEFVLINFEEANNIQEYEFWRASEVDTMVMRIQKSTIKEFINDQVDPGSHYRYRLRAFNVTGNSPFSSPVAVLTRPESPILFEESATNIMASSLKLSWESMKGTNNYRADISVAPAFNTKVNGYDNAIINNGQLITGLESGTVYYARLRSENSSGLSRYSEVLKFTTAPSSPVLEAQAISPSEISISWNLVESATAYQFKVFSEADTLSFSVGGNTGSKMVNDLLPGNEYSFEVQAVIESDLYSEPSNKVTLKTLPSAPALQEVSDVSNNTASLSWNDVEGVDFYEIDISTDEFFTNYVAGYQKRRLSSSNETVFNLVSGLSYYARVRAVNNSGSSGFSQTIKFATLPPAPNVRDASSVTTTSFRANWDVVEGDLLRYYIEVAEDENFKNLVFSDTLNSAVSVELSQLKEGFSHWYRVKAINLAGSSAFSEVIAVEQALLIKDLSFETEVSQADVSVIPVSFKVTGGTNQHSLQFNYKGILSSQYKTNTLEKLNENNIYEIEIPANFLDEIGLEFEIEVSDGENEKKISDNFIYWSDIEPIIPFQTVSNKWQLFSIPYLLEDNLIETIFDEMGPFRYINQWRLMHYDGAKYVDAGAGISRIELAKGYWFNTIPEIEINVGTGTVNTSSPYTLEIKEGWNQIGNPFNVPISWNSVIQSNNLSGSVQQVLLFNTNTQNFVVGDIINPYEGGFVWANSSVSVDIHIIENRDNNRVLTSDDIINSNIDLNNWNLSLKLQIRDELVDIATVGMHENASDDKDSFDQLVVPRFVTFTEMFTTHTNFRYPYFSKDIRKVKSDESWFFNLESNQLSGFQNISWDNTQLSSATKQLWLIDEQNGILINMNEINSYQFKLTGDHSFSIHLTKDIYSLPAPFKLSVGKIYPNPAKDLITFNLSLPESKENYDINIQIYSMRGEKIKMFTPVEKYAGIIKVALPIDDLEIESGTYIVKIEVQGDSKVRNIQKIIIQR